LAIWAIETVALTRTHKADRQYGTFWVRVITNQLPPLPYLIAGGLLAAGRPRGMY